MHSERADVRLLHAFGLDMPAGEVVLQHADKALFGVVAVLCAVERSPPRDRARERQIWADAMVETVLARRGDQDGT